MRLSSIYIEDLFGEGASSAYDITGTQKDLSNYDLYELHIQTTAIPDCYTVLHR